MTDMLNFSKLEELPKLTQQSAVYRYLATFLFEKKYDVRRVII